jgi:hypothetical protein
MIESPLEEWACSQAADDGWLVRKLKWIGRRNAPDRLFIKQGRVVFIEFKRPGATARQTQSRELDRLLAAGAEAHVVDNPLRALDILGVPYANVK